ncbi:TIGR00730 family Rossman fold protein [candidate division KSB1 bacterium]|nr:TIGR00730 family Rossman fold protein [candidate division KSB1 bacterium]
MKINRVCVFCASSRQVDNIYLESAYRLGAILAEEGITIVYGGGAVGLMGELARGALAQGGKVIGVIPRFMFDLEWGFQDITELKIVNDMHERKRLVMENADAIISLPGGSGTFDELFEAITMKRLGFYVNPIIIVNVKGFYNPLVELLDNCIAEKFMDARHRLMWSVVNDPEEVLPAIRNSPLWSSDSRHFAAI